MAIDRASRHLVEVLARSVLFEGWPPEVLSIVALRFRPRSVSAGAVVCAQGEPGDEMYVIEDGRFTVQAILGGKLTHLAEIGPGGVVGEMAIMTEQPRSATVSALTDARIWALHRRDFQELAQTYRSLPKSAGRLARERLGELKAHRLANENLTVGLVAPGGDQYDVLTIGRDASNDVVLNDARVSRHHARLERIGTRYQLVDLDSSNGTFVNGERVRTRILSPGDEIWIEGAPLYFDGSTITRFSRGGGIKVDGVRLSRVVGKGTTILHDVSLSIYPGEFVCIVGGSGAGKTTLLDSISGLRPPTTGYVRYNGLDYYDNVEIYRNSLGYVPQDDIVHPELTVEETLYFTARLRLPEDTRRGEIRERIGNVLEVLELVERRNTQVRRLSGGQRKRVSIGVELLTEPQIFYLDEPTSGLDPGLDTRMMTLLSDLAHEGRTVIATTHAIKNIMICDKVVVMARGGRLAYFGAPADALEYFGVSDFIEIYDVVAPDPEAWEKKYLQSDAYQRNVKQRLEGLTAGRSGAPPDGGGWRPGETEIPGSGGGADRRPKRVSAPRVAWHRQFFWLTVRYLRTLSRDRAAVAAILLAAPLLGYIYSALFSGKVFAMTWDEGGDARQGVALLGNLVNVMIFLGALVASRAIADEVAIYRRERLVNLKLFPYLLSKLSVLGLFAIPQAWLLLGMVSQTVNFPGGSEAYFKLYLVLVLTGVVSAALGLLVSSVCANGLQALLIMLVFLIPQPMLSGMIVPLGQMPDSAIALSLPMVGRWSLSMMGRFQDMNARLDAQYPTNDYADQFNVEPYVCLLVLAGFFLLYVVGAAVALKVKDARA